MITISASKLNTYSLCPRRFYWEYVLRIVPKVVQYPLVVGTIVHKGLEEWFQSGDDARVEAVVNTELQEIRSKYPISQEEFDAKLAYIEGMLYGFIEANGKMMGSWEIVANEHEFAVPLPINSKGDTVMITGRIDQIIKTDRCWIHEIKTRSSIDPREFDLFTLGYQPRLYNWYTSVAPQPEFKDVQGVMLSIIRKPAIRRRVKSGESHQEFTQRVREEFKTKPNEYFVTLPLRIGPHLEESFQRELVTLVKDIHRKLRKKSDPLGVWTMSPCNCDVYGGCPYLTLCQYGLNRRTVVGFKEREPESQPQLV